MATMKAWQYTSASGGLVKNLKLNNAAARPPSVLPKDKVLVEVISAALNPADYKIPELGLISRAVIARPASPGIDYCGKVVVIGSDIDTVKEGDLVFGRLDMPTQFGTLGQFIIAPRAGCVPLPTGIDPDHAACIGTAGMTEWECIVPYVKEGSKIFIHGGSGGTGTFGIQIAKVLGCHVTTSCSTGNVSLCKSIGADEVIDYKTTNVSEELKKKGQVFDLVVDNVGDPNDLYIAANTFLKSSGKFNQVGFQMGLAGIASSASRMLRPGFLGGGKRPFVIAMVQNEYDGYIQMGKWMQEGKLKAVIDSTYEYSDAPKAFERLKTGHAKGKVVVHVTKKPE